MYLRSSSPTGIRFLAAIKRGNGLTTLARAVGFPIGTPLMRTLPRVVAYRITGVGTQTK